MHELTPPEFQNEIEVRVLPWIQPGTGGIVVRRELRAELKDLLTDAEIGQPPTVRDVGVLQLVAFVVGNAAFWPSLAGVIKVLVNRHHGKRVRIVVEAGRVTTEFDGFSHEQIESFMDLASQRFAEGEQRWTSPDWVLEEAKPEEDEKTDPGLDF